MLQDTIAKAKDELTKASLLSSDKSTNSILTMLAVLALIMMKASHA